MSDSRPRTALAATALFLLSFAVYFGVGRYYLVLDAYPNELLPDAMVRHHTLTLDPYWSAASPDLPYFAAAVRGHAISYYPIVPGLLNIPSYLVASAAGVSFHELANRQAIARATAAWTTAASVACLYLFLVRLLPAAGCRRSAARAALGFALLYAFATCVWPIAARALWQHGPQLMFLTAALACLVRPESRWFPLAGFLLGMAVWNRPLDLAFAAPLALYVALHHRARLPAFAAAAALPALGLAAYSQLYWGSVTALGQGHRAAGTMLGVHYHLRGPLLAGLAGVLVSPARGLFVFTPVFLLAVPELARALVRPRHPLLRYLGLGAVATIALIAKTNVWWGGHSFGYRYVLGAAPAFTALLAVAWCAWPPAGVARRRLHVAFWPLALIGLYVQFLGAVYFPCGWNATPVDVDHHPERLWDVRDTELGRCQGRLLADLRSPPGRGRDAP